MKVGIITGASSGFGAEFVKQIDTKYQLDELWIVARRLERLEELAKTVNTKVRCFGLDLSKAESYDVLADAAKKEDATVALLINNAGYGYFEAFWNQPLEKWMNMIDLNDKAMVGLTYKMLPYMTEGSEIYNTCSTSAFQPVPYITIYGATKAFALSFTRALNMELKPRKIKAMAICPHWTKTEFFNTAVTNDDVIVYYNHFNTAERVVSHAIKNMKKGKDVSTVDFAVKFQLFLVKVLPHKFVMKTWMKQQKKPLK